MEANSINCPHCGSTIDVNEILYNQMHSEMTREFTAKINREEKDLERKNGELEKERKDLHRLRVEIDNEISSRLSKELIAERSKLEKQLRIQVGEEVSEELRSYKEQLAEKIVEAKGLNKLRADFQKLQREKTELKEQIEAEAELKITTQVEQERKKIRKDAEEKNELKLAEKEHIINQLKNQLTEAQKKAEQGSQQLRGEVLELGLEEHLKENFPLDLIEEVKKGIKGADCLHTVRTPAQQVIGTIYYETKRTKDFQATWIEKFKVDMRARNASIGVIVTETYPKGVERLSLMEGIWICSYEEAKGLCFVLRESLVLLSSARASQVDRANKREVLYDYMSSNEFKMQIEAIVEGFTEMQCNLMKERRSMEAIWKQREKQIEKVILNTTHIYSSIKGISGNAIGTIKILELGGGAEEVTRKKLPHNKISIN